MKLADHGEKKTMDDPNLQFPLSVRSAYRRHFVSKRSALTLFSWKCPFFFFKLLLFLQNSF